MKDPNDPRRVIDGKGIERFWSKVHIGSPDECWEWGGVITVRGYGLFTSHGVDILAHRAAFIFANNKDIPPGLVVRHSCNNPACVNPAHLSIGTQADNMRDRYSVEGSTVATEESVLEMRRLRLEGWTYARLSEEFDISITQARAIINGKYWSWVKDEAA